MDFLKKKRDFVDLIIKHIGTSAIMDLLLRLLTCIEPPQPRQEVLNVSSQAAWAGCGIWVGFQGRVVRVWETGVGGRRRALPQEETQVFPGLGFPMCTPQETQAVFLLSSFAGFALQRSGKADWICLSWSGGKSRNGKVGSSVSFEQAVRNLLCLEEMSPAGMSLRVKRKSCGISRGSGFGSSLMDA